MCKSQSLRNLNHSLDLLDRMMYLHIFPSIVDFTQLLGMVVKVKNYSEVITLIEKLESLQPKIYPNVYNMSVLINCFCHLN